MMGVMSFWGNLAMYYSVDIIDGVVEVMIVIEGSRKATCVN